MTRAALIHVLTSTLTPHNVPVSTIKALVDTLNEDSHNTECKAYNLGYDAGHKRGTENGFERGYATAKAECACRI